MNLNKIIYSKKTCSMLVSAIPEYNEVRSSPFEGIYIWTYQINIENQGDLTPQLLSRHWKIIDASGQVREVQGDGVIGLQPFIAPGEKFNYSSETSLPTPSGIMLGTYQMRLKTGEKFTIDIPAFSLDCPYIKEALN